METRKSTQTSWASHDPIAPSFLSMRRPMQCVCCCFCRPTAEVAWPMWDLGVSMNGDTPKWMVYSTTNIEKPIQMDGLGVPPFEETFILPCYNTIQYYHVSYQDNDHMVVARISTLQTWQCTECVCSARPVCPVFSLQSKIQRCTRVQAGKDPACRESRALNRHQTY